MLIRNVKVEKYGNLNTTDIGIFYEEKQSAETGKVYYKAIIGDMGDLSTFYGYKEIDAEGMTLSFGKTYPRIFDNYKEIVYEDAIKWLSDGYTQVRLKTLPSDEEKTNLPLKLISEDHNRQPSLRLGGEVYFLLQENGEQVKAICNEGIISLNK